MLEQIIKAEKRGLLDKIKEQCPCPVSLTLIQNFVAILISAYLFNIAF
jgi:hypothetical protein